MTDHPDGPGPATHGDGRPEFLPPPQPETPAHDPASHDPASHDPASHDSASHDPASASIYPDRSSSWSRRQAVDPDSAPVRRNRSSSSSRRRALVAVVLAGGLLLIGLLSALPVVPTVAPAPTAPPPIARPDVVTASPSPAAGRPDTMLSGGDLGKPVPFTSGSGSGTLTVVSASWTDAGEVQPEPGRRYLVLDVTVACTKGEVPVDPILLLVTTGQEGHLPGFGPSLQRPLGGRLLSSGQRVTGQVGYALAPGAVEVSLLDESLRRLARVELPSP